MAACVLKGVLFFDPRNFYNVSFVNHGMIIKINIGPITENSKYLLEKFKIEQFNDPYQKNNSNLPQ